jgi:hypothetical protein
MRFRAAARLVLILLPLTTTASRLHAHHVDAPDLATQEVNRCLNLIKIAASKRGDGRKAAISELSRSSALRNPIEHL